jgi:hypothetical protein
MKLLAGTGVCRRRTSGMQNLCRFRVCEMCRSHSAWGLAAAVGATSTSATAGARATPYGLQQSTRLRTAAQRAVTVLEDSRPA